jgi:hypothetical protein
MISDAFLGFFRFYVLVSVAFSNSDVFETWTDQNDGGTVTSNGQKVHKFSPNILRTLFALGKYRAGSTSVANDNQKFSATVAKNFDHWEKCVTKSCGGIFIVFVTIVSKELILFNYSKER